jgi:hypothetical protein
MIDSCVTRVLGRVNEQTINDILRVQSIADDLFIYAILSPSLVIDKVSAQTPFMIG